MSTEGAQVRTARVRKEKQRRQHVAAQLNRVRSVVNQEVMDFVRGSLSIHQVLPAAESGQLPDLG